MEFSVCHKCGGKVGLDYYERRSDPSQRYHYQCGKDIYPDLEARVRSLNKIQYGKGIVGAPPTGRPAPRLQEEYPWSE